MAVNEQQGAISPASSGEQIGAAAQSPKSPTGSGTRSSLGLGSTTPKSPIGSGNSSNMLGMHQRNATVIGVGTSIDSSVDSTNVDDDVRRRRAGRRQSEDTMRAMRSLDRQYGRRRRLNTDQGSVNSSVVAPVSVVAANGKPSVGRPRVPMKRGDSRALFAPLLAASPSEVMSPSQAAPTLHSPAGSVAGSARLARQLIMIAGKLAQGGTSSGDGVAESSSGGGDQGAVRPRASMPLINGSRRLPQRTRSQAHRKTRDELADALTMKSVEIRGGRIVLDDPSSSGSDSDSEDALDGPAPSASAALFGRVRQRPSISSVITTNTNAAAASVAGEEAAYWEDVLRRRWYTRRCLGLKQPFASVHKLVQAEHVSEAPFPLISDLRRVLHESQALFVEPDGTETPVDVLVCTDAVVVSAPRTRNVTCNGFQSSVPLRAIEFSEELAIRVADNGDVVELAEDEYRVKLRFAQGAAAAQAWCSLVEQAQLQLCAVLQDLRLDEEDFVERPPPPLLLARGRSSIAGATPSAINALGAPQRSRNAAQGGVYWVPDAETAVCMVCQKTAFSMMVRRHHCRSCGLVICYRCSIVGADRYRICIRCNAPARRTGSLGTAFAASTSASVAAAIAAPKPSPSLHTLGGRRAEELGSNGLPMHAAAAQRKNESRMARRPLSSLFPIDGSSEPASSAMDQD
ncbi:hypothetical protein LPJ57_000369 [Coemansia sp. RSA 486]|nr:hypothetical protein LPJ57_000369 [Coemansia sp. RSA 486]KAJ2602667.1 hypothetical protein GGF39_000545 [Coemansia sp. RSA 1721]KAJ2640280.1 hypothetical protein GGF40_000179 [Coemansia sp. RSA 1286]